MPSDSSAALPAQADRAAHPSRAQLDSLLRDYQRQSYDFLTSSGRGAVWDEAGLGKTRCLALAAQGRTLVVATAAIRDTRVWETEAATIGVEPFEVISYQQTLSAGFSEKYKNVDTLILDEAHRLKDRKVSWAVPINNLARSVQCVFQATGTPMPNSAWELWAQLHAMYPAEFKHFWPWIENWFGDTIPNRYNPDARDIPLRLFGCRCADDATCTHWDEFHAANIAGRAIRHLRDDVLKDLPPLSGHDSVLDCPMDATQKRLYASLKKDLLASIPEEGIFLEALTESHVFSQLQQLSFGLSSLDPTQDPGDKHSGKLPVIAELLSGRSNPTVVTAWFRNSASAIERLCKSMRLSCVMVGGKTRPKARAEAVADFQAGKIDVLIGSVGVIKEGITLHRADEIVLGERSWVPGDNEQVIRRLHRLGQTRPVTARQLVTPKSVDSYQWSVAGPIGVKARGIKSALRRSEIASLI